MATTTTDEILLRRLAEGWRIRIEPMPGGTWRCSVREDDVAPWTSLRAGHGGFTTPLESVQDTDARLTALIASRAEVVVIESLADLDLVMSEQRLDRRRNGGGEVVWVARGKDGVETEPAPTPSAAVAKLPPRDRGRNRTR